MKKNYTILCLFLSLGAFAQVGISNTAPKAQLDITATNAAAPSNTDGILIPRIAAFPVTIPTADQHGMMVFLNTASGINQSGFYYWNQPTANWIPFLSGSNNQGWGLSGNLGTNPNNNYVGTTDNVDLVLRTNKKEQVRIKNDGRVEIGLQGTNAIYHGQTSTLKKLYVAANDANNNVVFQSSTANGDPLSMYFGNSRGTTLIPTVSSTTNTLANIYFSGYDGDEFLNASGIKAELNGISNNSCFGRLSFLTANGMSDVQERMAITPSGNVGIAVASPTEKLHVLGNLRMVDGNQAVGKVLTSDANGVGTWSNLPDTSAPGWTLAGNSGTTAANYIGTADNMDFSIRTNNLLRARISALGDFGIGVAAPTERLHVLGKIRMVDGNQAAGKIMTSDANGVGTWQTNPITDWSMTGNAGTTAVNFIGTTDAQPFNIRTNNGTRVRILATGEMGIGTTTPDRKLEVSGAGIQYARISNTGSTEVGLELKRSGSDWQMRNDGGDLIFGQSNDDLITVADVVRIGGSTFTPVTDGFPQLGQNTRRWASVHAINGVVQTSDANDKKKIFDLTDGLAKIKRLRPISFQWKDDNIDQSSTHLGFVAQEVQKVLPEVVVDADWEELPEGKGRVWKKTVRLGMKYSEIVPVLVKAAQEQQEQLEALRLENELLKKQLEQQTAAFEKRLERLENKR